MHAFVVNGESGGGAGGSAECIDIARTAVQNTAASTAHDIIEAIASDLGLAASALTAEDRRRIRYGLEDGAALAYLGFGDADQDAIEEAHGMMQ